MFIQRTLKIESWFWQLQTGAEFNYLEDADGHLDAFEFKWGKKQARVPASFALSYPDYTFASVNRENWQDFVNSAAKE